MERQPRKNAFLVNVGGGHADVPHFHDFWWNETVIKIETAGGGKGNYETGVEIFWFVKQIPIPEKIWKYKDEIVKMILEALSVDPDWCGIEYLKSINVNLACEPIMIKE